jgi:hypothetical protein
MIPDYPETINKIEAEFPGWCWLLRNNNDKRGNYFFHLHEQEFITSGYQSGATYPMFGASAAVVAYEAYCFAKDARERGMI